jgi:hypothetical protein
MVSRRLRKKSRVLIGEVPNSQEFLQIDIVSGNSRQHSFPVIRCHTCPRLFLKGRPSKAAEQLAHDKLEVRLGGIYTMEPISQESARDYWPVIETLTAFVRKKARWKEPEENVSESVARFYETPQSSHSEMPTDIAAVLSVLKRRDASNHQRESGMRWHIDLRGSDLRGAQLIDASFRYSGLAKANLASAELNRADLSVAVLDGPNLTGADLRGADLTGADLSTAQLARTHLIKAVLCNANLFAVDLEGAFLHGANLEGVHLERANLDGAAGLRDTQLAVAFGDASTILPYDVKHPATWSRPEPDPD